MHYSPLVSNGVPGLSRGEIWDLALFISKLLGIFWLNVNIGFLPFIPESRHEKSDDLFLEAVLLGVFQTNRQSANREYRELIRGERFGIQH